MKRQHLILVSVLIYTIDNVFKMKIEERFDFESLAHVMMNFESDL